MKEISKYLDTKLFLTFCLWLIVSKIMKVAILCVARGGKHAAASHLAPLSSTERDLTSRRHSCFTCRMFFYIYFLIFSVQGGDGKGKGGRQGCGTVAGGGGGGGSRRGGGHPAGQSQPKDPTPVQVGPVYPANQEASSGCL
jgi:hypothetical protein